MRIAVVGLGFMGGVHVKASAAAPGVELAAIVSRDASKCAAYPDVKVYRDVAKALEDLEIDAVDLCLPTDLHESVTIAALRRGKHVLVEKPMALDEAACARMIDEARKAKRVLMVAHVLRFFPAYEALQNSIDAGELGSVRAAYFRRRCARPSWSDWITDASRSGGGVFDLLIHDVDMMLRLFGAPRAISAAGYEDRAAGVDTISAKFFYDSGLAAEINGGWLHAGGFPFSMEFTILGDRGVLDYNSESRPLKHHIAGGESKSIAVGQIDGYAAQIAYFAKCVQSGEEPLRCRPEDSAEAVRLARAMIAARSRNGEMVEWK